MNCLSFRGLHGVVQRAANWEVRDLGSGVVTTGANFVSDLRPARPALSLRPLLDWEGFSRDDHLKRHACIPSWRVEGHP